MNAGIKESMDKMASRYRDIGEQMGSASVL